MLEPPKLSTSMFVEEEDAEGFTCGICREVYENPYAASCEHTLCRGCAEEKMKFNSTCPICRKKIGPDTKMKKDMMNARVKCFTRQVKDTANVEGLTDVDANSGTKRKSSSSSSSSSGEASKRAKPEDFCKWTGELKDAEVHLYECNHADERCSLGCGAIVKRMDMKEHQANSCANRAKECPNEGCSEMVSKAMRAEHNKSCPHGMIPCPFSGVGCSDQIKRNDLERHMETHASTHCRLLLEDNGTKQERIEGMEEKIEEVEQDNRALRLRVTRLETMARGLQQQVNSLQQDKARTDNETRQRLSTLESNSKRKLTTVAAALLGGVATVAVSTVATTAVSAVSFIFLNK